AEIIRRHCLSRSLGVDALDVQVASGGTGALAVGRSPLEHGHLMTRSGQLVGRRGAEDPGADHHHVSPDHSRLSSMAIAARTGIGFTGIRAGWQPTGSPVHAETRQDTVLAHSRPWHGPIPARVAPLTPFRSFQPSRAAARISP